MSGVYRAVVTLAGAALLAACSSSRAVDSRSAPPPPGGQPPGGGPDWPMFGFVSARTNDGPDSTGITAANVSGLKRTQVSLPGTVDASAIYLHRVTVAGAAHDVFVVTTTYGKTVAVDASDGTILWTFTPDGYGGWAGSARITNTAPVADPDRQSVYAAAPDGAIRKLALADGHALWTTSITQLPTREKITSALNIDQGHVLAATGGYIGDAPPYQGHVVVLDTAGGRVLATWNSLCSDQRSIIAPASCPAKLSAIWAPAGVVVEPTSHRLLFSTGNGPFDGHTNWGDSMIELSPDASSMVAHWTPVDYRDLESSDADLGSTSPALLAGGYVAQAGKDGKLRLLQLSALPGPGTTTDGELQTVSTPGGAPLFSSPAVMDGTWLFVADRSGTDAWHLVGNRLQKAWGNGTAGTSPVVAGSLLWVYDPGGALNVYDPTTGRLLTSLPAGSGHWQSPIVGDGRVVLAQGSANDHATSGLLNVYYLP